MNRWLTCPLWRRLEINEEGIYRKNGVSHKINQFIERNYANLASSTITPSSYSVNSTSIYGGGGGGGGYNSNANDPLVNESSTSSSTSSSNHNTNSHHSLFSSVIKSTVNNFYLLSHSSSSSTLNAFKNDSNHSNSNTQGHLMDSPSIGQHSSSSTMTRNNSNSNLNNVSYTTTQSMSSYHGGGNNDLEDTCTITSALKHYLIHLKEPLMTYHFNQQFLNTCRKRLLKRSIRSGLFLALNWAGLLCRKRKSQRSNHRDSSPVAHASAFESGSSRGLDQAFVQVSGVWVSKRSLLCFNSPFIFCQSVNSQLGQQDDRFQFVHLLRSHHFPNWTRMRFQSLQHQVLFRNHWAPHAPSWKGKPARNVHHSSWPLVNLNLELVLSDLRQDFGQHVPEQFDTAENACYHDNRFHEHLESCHQEPESHERSRRRWWWNEQQ